MATDNEVIEAKKKVEDTDTLETSLTQLSDIIAGTGAISILIKRDGVTFDFASLKALLKSGNANEDTMITNIETVVTNAIGADEITANTIRKELRDLVTAHDADIAAT